jgi:UDP-N-acetylmuramoyl-L-alanyl-D-glutamate--2,6-diaminopimelate ligase
MPAVRGRFEQIPSPAGWTAVVDYAHTPDALENCLQAIRAIVPAGARVLTVFGCGGNRDAGKRPEMGRIASRLSDVTVITSDNPRREEPLAIIRQIRAGVEGDREVVTEPDRRAAICLALDRAVSGDVVLIAGKGHEQYQVIGEVRMHFDDREEIEKYIRSHG